MLSDESKQRAGFLAEESRRRAETISGPVGEVPTLDAYVELMRRPLETRYREVPPELERASRALIEGSPAREAAFNRHALTRLLRDVDLVDCCLRVPRSVLALQHQELRRILAELEERDDDFYRLSNDDFLKELSIVSWKLLPLGGLYAERLPRTHVSAVLGGAPRERIRGLAFIVFRMHGWGPLVRGHEHSLVLRRLDEEEWHLTHHRAADLLALNSSLKALDGESWQVDPEIPRISPRIAFVRQLPSENGGATFFVRRDALMDHLATLKSGTRRRLYQEGTYRPEVHLAVWPRRALISWSERTRDPSWGPVGEESRVPDGSG